MIIHVIKRSIVILYDEAVTMPIISIS